MMTRTTTFTAVFAGKVWWLTKTDTKTLKVTVGAGVKLSPVFVQAAKDSANVSTDGPWQYYDVTK